MEELSKSINDILDEKNKYIVPLYQRNFAWEEEEITRLLRDIYESFLQNKDKPENEKGNYYIGSLVVIKRKNDDFEVIDGQQRLTAITLITKILEPNKPMEPKLFYDSRPEVEAFYRTFYKKGNTNDVTFDHKVSHFINAVDYINDAKLNLCEDNKSITINSLDDNHESFKRFFFENVYLVFVELPQDTDVAKYFEIMNNRGVQLQKQEILKAELLNTVKINNKHDRTKQLVYSKIWDACSQMDKHIQKLFPKSVKDIEKDILYRNSLFGENYDAFPTKERLENLVQDARNKENLVQDARNKSGDGSSEKYTIDFIINDIGDDDWNKDDNKREGADKSIIDFPNFLMHILKLKYSEKYKSLAGNDKSIPLNEKDLLSVFNVLKKEEINADEFILDLLYYRTVFDRYIIKATTDGDSEDKIEWTLEQPVKYDSGLDYKNSFESEHERIIKCLSMLQVSFRDRTHKNWLQSVLSWFTDNKGIITSEDYCNKLQGYMLNYYENKIGNISNDYSEGTGTPRYLFNFIDYLYWADSKNNSNKYQIGKFDFRYRNSIEHHRPQSRRDNVPPEWIDSLGNLCLVSKGSNSRMNNEEPTGKAKVYYKENLPPKRKIMYDISYDHINNQEKSWGETEIIQHCNDVIQLLNRREDILKS